MDVRNRRLLEAEWRCWCSRRSLCGSVDGSKVKHERERRSSERSEHEISMIGTAGSSLQRRSVSAASYMRVYAVRAGDDSFVVLKAAITTAVVAGLKNMNERNPA